MDCPLKPILEKLAGVGLTQEKLKNAKQLVDDVEKAAADHEAAKGKAMMATEQRNQAFRVFKKWMKAFNKVCRIALADSPQKLEKLGMIVKS